MKQILLSVIMSFVALFSFGQCTELFISEYVEGSHNNKALEIYNPTQNSIDLSGYRIARYSNGGSSPQFLDLGGSLASADVLVIVLDKQDPAGTGTDTIVFDELRALADTFMSGVYPGPMYFNGNDAVTLEKTNGTYVDILGVIGQNPGQAWTADTAAGFTDALGGRWWTKNHAMIRKPTVSAGITANPTFFNPAAEWDTLGYNWFGNLGWHSCNCTPNSIAEVKKVNDAFFYPNPVTGSTFTVKATAVISSVSISNIAGSEVFNAKNDQRRGDMIIPASNLNSGVYFVSIILEDQSIITKKLIRK
ncbi:MAG: lamin tail domain-containing protein [Bacteroidales bacterium]|nr:lamin tail domain-containing protein [Bacteroidales bacterium]